MSAPIRVFAKTSEPVNIVVVDPKFVERRIYTLPGNYLLGVANDGSEPMHFNGLFTEGCTPAERVRDLRELASEIEEWAERRG